MRLQRGAKMIFHKQALEIFSPFLFDFNAAILKFYTGKKIVLFVLIEHFKFWNFCLTYASHFKVHILNLSLSYVEKVLCFNPIVTLVSLPRNTIAGEINSTAIHVTCQLQHACLFPSVFLFPVQPRPLASLLILFPFSSRCYRKHCPHFPVAQSPRLANPLA